MFRFFSFYTDALIGHIALPAFYAVVLTDLAGGADGFVVIGGHAESGAQLFVEFAQFNELVFVSWNFFLVMGKQEFLIAGVPQGGELTLQHNAGNLRHLKTVPGCLAKLRAAIVFLDADDAAGAADEKSLGGERFHLGLVEQFVDVPHAEPEY